MDVRNIFALLSSAHQKPKENDCNNSYSSQFAGGILIGLLRNNSPLTIFPVFPVRWWWMFMMISQRLFLGGLAGGLTVKDFNKFSRTIFKRIAGNFVRDSQEFFAQACFHIGMHRIAWDLFSEFYEIPRDHAATSRRMIKFPKLYRPSLFQAYLYVVSGEKLPNLDAAFEILGQFYLLPFLKEEKKMSKNEWKFFLEIMQMIIQTQKNSAIEYLSLDDFVDNDSDSDWRMSPTSHDDIVFYFENVEFLKEVDRLLQLLDRLIQAV
jgi:hypothetical protein